MNQGRVTLYLIKCFERFRRGWGSAAGGRRFPVPVSGQAQQRRGQDVQSEQSAHPGPQNVRATPRQDPNARQPPGQKQGQAPGRSIQEQQGRGQSMHPLLFDPHNILETWVSPGPSPRAPQTQNASGHSPAHEQPAYPGHEQRLGQGQQERGQNIHSLPFDPDDILSTETWVPHTPGPRFSQAQHASGHHPNHGQSLNPGRGRRLCRFSGQEHDPDHLSVHYPSHLLAPCVHPLPFGTYVVRFAHSMGRPAVGIWRANADGTWSPVVNLQGGSGEVVLPL